MTPQLTQSFMESLPLQQRVAFAARSQQAEAELNLHRQATASIERDAAANRASIEREAAANRRSQEQIHDRSSARFNQIYQPLYKDVSMDVDIGAMLRGDSVQVESTNRQQSQPLLEDLSGTKRQLQFDESGAGENQGTLPPSAKKARIEEDAKPAAVDFGAAMTQAPSAAPTAGFSLGGAATRRMTVPSTAIISDSSAKKAPSQAPIGGSGFVFGGGEKKAPSETPSGGSAFVFGGDEKKAPSQAPGGGSGFVFGGGEKKAPSEAPSGGSGFVFGGGEKKAPSQAPSGGSGFSFGGGEKKAPSEAPSDGGGFFGGGATAPSEAPSGGSGFSIGNGAPPLPSGGGFSFGGLSAAGQGGTVAFAPSSSFFGQGGSNAARKNPLDKPSGLPNFGVPQSGNVLSNEDGIARINNPEDSEEEAMCKCGFPTPPPGETCSICETYDQASDDEGEDEEPPPAVL
jgi:hypothetical protein